MKIKNPGDVTKAVTGYVMSTKRSLFRLNYLRRLVTSLPLFSHKDSASAN